MRQSVCVLNPSLFEGFGLSVDEANCLGKRVLLSDLPVFREQAHPDAAYFEPTRLSELVEKMAETWRLADAGPDADKEKRARRNPPGELAHLRVVSWLSPKRPVQLLKPNRGGPDC